LEAEDNSSETETYNQDTIVITQAIEDKQTEKTAMMNPGHLCLERMEYPRKMSIVKFAWHWPGKLEITKWKRWCVPRWRGSPIGKILSTRWNNQNKYFGIITTVVRV
jgi:hypothetical protein